MLSDMLDLTCQIQKVADSLNNMGGPIKTYSERIASASCSFRQLPSTPTDQYDKAGTVIVYRFYFEYSSTNSTIIATDRIVISSRTFEIDYIYNVAGKNDLYQMDCTEVV